jgi:drug/metabolite transporter (DMT)-like permease
MPPATAIAPARPAGASSLLLFFIPTAIWGTTWFAIRFQLGVVEPEVSVAWRFGLASLLLLGWCAARRIPLRHSARDHAGFVVLGLLLFAVNYVLVYRSEAYLTSGLVAVLFSFLVFWNLVGARLLYRVPAPAGVWAGAALGVGGVGLLFWPELTSLRGGSGQALGVGLAGVGTVIASAGNLYSQRLFARGIAVVPGTAWAMAYAALAVMGWCALRGVPFAFDPRPGYLLSLLYLALLGSVVAFVSYLTLLQRIGAGRAGYTAVLIPVVAMIASTLFEHYRWTPAALAGMGLVLAGTLLVSRAKERATFPPARRAD